MWLWWTCGWLQRPSSVSHDGTFLKQGQKEEKPWHIQGKEEVSVHLHSFGSHVLFKLKSDKAFVLTFPLRCPQTISHLGHKLWRQFSTVWALRISAAFSSLRLPLESTPHVLGYADSSPSGSTIRGASRVAPHPEGNCFLAPYSATHAGPIKHD